MLKLNYLENGSLLNTVVIDNDRVIEGDLPSKFIARYENAKYTDEELGTINPAGSLELYMANFVNSYSNQASLRFDETGWDEVDYLTRDADEEPDLVDFILEAHGKKLDTSLNGWIKSIKSKLKSYEDPEAAKKALDKNPEILFDLLTPTKFTKDLEQLMLLADLAGRVEVVDEEDESRDDSTREDAQRPEWLRLSFSQAVKYFKEKVPVPVASYKSMVEGYHNWAFSVTGVTRGDVLDAIKFLLDEAIAKGNSQETFNKQFDRLVARKGWDVGGGRRKIIFDTNVRSAYSAGREAQMRDPDVIERRPYWLWRHRDSVVPRPTHLALDNKAIPADHKFWDVCPPGNCAFGCRCGAFAVTEAQIKAMGAQILNNPPDPKTVAEEGFRGGRRPFSDDARQEMIDQSLDSMSPETRKVVEKALQKVP